jgi:transcriptional regulator with XRE-family HTH domain
MTLARDEALLVADEFGWNLRRARRRKGFSQDSLAMRAALHRTEIGKLENGERVCRIDTLIRLAGAMDFAPGDLLDGISWIPGPKPGGTFVLHNVGRGSVSTRGIR